MKCNDFVLQFAALKESFIQNQKLLNDLLSVSEETVIISEELGDQDCISNYSESFQEASESNDEQSFATTAEKRIQEISTPSIPKSEKGWINCDECQEYKTTRKTDFLIHKWRAHNGPKLRCDFICELCSKEYHYKANLQRHLYKHNNYRRYSCG